MKKSIIQTITTEEVTKVKLTYPYPSVLSDHDTLDITIIGQVPGRTIEDRSVFLNFRTKPKRKEKAYNTALNGSFWLNAEDAIEVGTKLIEAGSFAFKANMVQHQKRWAINKLQGFIREERVKYILVKVIDRSPKNYGHGFKAINITPIWKKGKSPKYQDDFNFDTVIYAPNKASLDKNITPIIKNLKWDLGL